MEKIIFLLYISSLFISAVFAVIYRKALRDKKIGILVPYLVFVFAQELFLFFYVKNNPNISTDIFYSVYRPITFFVFASIFYRLPFSHKKWISIVIGIYIVMSIAVLGFVKGDLRGTLQSISTSFVMTCMALLFMFEYFSLDDAKQEKYWKPLLWIAIGLVLFYPVNGIVNSFHSKLIADKAELFGQKLYQLNPRVMSIFMYGLFSYAFYLCSRKNSI